MLCMDYSKLWMSKSYFHRFEFTKLFSFSGFLQNAWTWIATLRVCSFFFFSCEFHDFLICSDASWTHSPLDCRILGRASATIWKSHAGKPVSKFTSTFFLSSSNCTFIVYHKRSSPTPFMLSILTSHFTQPSCTRNNWANHKVRKEPAYQKTLTYILAILLDIRTSFWCTNSQTDSTNGLGNE